MFEVRTAVVACLVVGVVCGGAGAWFGAGAARDAERLRWIEASRKAENAALEAAGGAADAEVRRSAAAERAASEAVSRAWEVKRESVVVDRPGGEWVDAERVRLDRLHAAYFGGAGGAACGVSGGLCPSSDPDRGAVGMGGADAGLGLRVPTAGERVRSVGEGALWGRDAASAPSADSTGGEQ